MRYSTVFLALTLSCSPALDPERYARDCERAEDCVAVRLDNLCGCGGVDSAVNARELDRVEADLNAASAFCGPRLFTTCDGLSAPMRAVCAEGVCGIEPDVPDSLPMFSWSSPFSATVVPTNVRVTGSIFRGTDPTIELTAAVIVDGEESPRPISLDSTGNCGLIGGCETILDLNPLPPVTSVTLAFEPETPGTNAVWTTLDGPDDEPPTVSPLILRSNGVSGDENRDVFKNAQFDVVFPDDNIGIAGFGALRSVDGGEEQLLERLTVLSQRFIADRFREDSGAEEACYSLVAWDWAGNESRSEPVCVDASVSTEERESLFGSCQSIGDTADFAIFALIVVTLRVGRRSSPAANRTT